MDILITTHTEFGFVSDKHVIPDKNATDGVYKGVPNLIKIADKYGAKITFAVMPEVTTYFPKDIDHELGLHIHSGWEEFHRGDFSFYVGDSFLRENTNQSSTSTVLRDYSYEEQLDMIKIGKDHIYEKFGIDPTSFVAGRWSINNDTVKALIKTGFKCDCSAPAHSRPCHHDWSKLPRICMPYHPSADDYQRRGDLHLLEIPVSQMFPSGNVNPESVPVYGLSWFKACFLEYYNQNAPLFHICLHSPCMVDPYFTSAMDDFLKFISKHDNINFRFASEIAEYNDFVPKTNILPYLPRINRSILRIGLKTVRSKAFGGRK